MTNTTPLTPRAIPDVPLPGHYSCLTAQINLTLSVDIGTVKWIAVLRDPTLQRQVELSREGGITPWINAQGVIVPAVDRVLDGMQYLSMLPAPR